MSKATLVIDMPSNCSECPCCYVPRCEVLEKSLKPSEIYECKPDWCPLREVLRKEEFIKKLIERLEEKDDDCGCGKIDVWEAIEIVNKLAEEYNKESVKVDLISRSTLLKQFAEATQYGCGNVGIKFVDELIKKQPTAYNDEWIPCSEDKPKENGRYECWYMVSAIGEEKEYIPITLYWEDNIWLFHPNGFSMPTQKDVVAWKPIAPYQSEG